MKMRNVPTTDSLGSRVKQIRQHYGYSQSTFGSMLGVSPSHISNVEGDKENPSKTLILLMSHVFCIRYDWIESGAGEKYSLEMAEQVHTLKEMIKARDALWDMVDSMDKLLWKKFSIKRRGQ